MIVRPGNQRGYADHGWLRSYHTFSFANYYDPKHMGFRSLRVINEDRVEGGEGFGTHSHRDMEIISYVLEGELAHQDSMGNGEIIRPGEVQRMSAGTGVRHSEFNNAQDSQVHFLQIWIEPDRNGLAPSYEQKAYPIAERQDQWRLVAARDGREGAVTVHQDVNLYAALLGPAQSLQYTVADSRYVWLHVARGSVEVNGQALMAGDAAAFDPDEVVKVMGKSDAEVLLFDLA